MLRGNHNIINHNFGKILAGNLPPWQVTKQMNRYAFVVSEGSTNTQYWANPTGTEAPYSYMLPIKGGELSTGGNIRGQGSLTSSVTMGRTLDATLAGDGDLSASLALLSALTANLSGSGDLSALVQASLGLFANLSGSGDLSASLSMSVPFAASLSGDGTVTANLRGMASMSATIYVNFSEATVQQIVDGVWNATATEYDNPGTMGEAAQTGGGGGGYTPAQIADAVWDEPLTGATHNVPTSAGRRLRQLGSIAVYDGIAQGPGVGDNQIQLDTGASSINGEYDPSEIAIIAGTGAGQSRLILQYNGTTRTATVDRDWRVKPDATSEFIIYVNSGREHVNEGLAQGGTSNTITLNANASGFDDAYNGQIVFLRSGTGADQVARVTDYNGTTKVATIETAIGAGWVVIPDTTTAYVMIPYIGVSGGSGGLTPTQATQLENTVKRGDIILNAGDISIPLEP